jgi:SARP family transcriptional regulator, regulator of embCAB operon
MRGAMQSRVQVCGPLLMRIEGERREGALPGRQGRQITAYLVVNRHRVVGREELIDATWPDVRPDGAGDTLTSLISRIRRALGPELLAGRSELRLQLPADTVVDIEEAAREIHRAESAVAQAEHGRAWASARAALHTSSRGFLPGYEAPWIDEQRRDLEDLRLRALDAVAATGLALGGPELTSAERSARALIAAAPLRESGYRYLMEYLAARDEVAEALVVYDELRTRLRDELGIAPGRAIGELHARLLAQR